MQISIIYHFSTYRKIKIPKTEEAENSYQIIASSNFEKPVKISSQENKFHYFVSIFSHQ